MPQLTKGQKFIKSHKKQVKKASERAQWHKSRLDRADRQIQKIKIKIEDLDNKINRIKGQRKLDIKKIQRTHHRQEIQRFECCIDLLSARIEEIDDQVRYHRVLYHTHKNKYI